MFFVVAGFSHSIADMTYCALALFGKSAPACAAAAQAAGADLSVLTWSRYFLGNMLPVTLGNTACWWALRPGTAISARKDNVP